MSETDGCMPHKCTTIVAQSARAALALRMYKCIPFGSGQSWAAQPLWHLLQQRWNHTTVCMTYSASNHNADITMHPLSIRLRAAFCIPWYRVESHLPSCASQYIIHTCIWLALRLACKLVILSQYDGGRADLVYTSTDLRPPDNIIPPKVNTHGLQLDILAPTPLPVAGQPRPKHRGTNIQKHEPIRVCTFFTSPERSYQDKVLQ